MAFIPAPDCVSAEIRYLWNGQHVENTLYFLASGAVDLTTMLTLADFLADWREDEIKTLQGSTCIFQEVYITDLTSVTSPTQLSALHTNTAGTASGASLPNNASIAISFRTPGRGRSSRGRNYLVGLTEDETTGNTVSSVTLGLYRAAYELLVSNPPAGWTWVVLSRYFNNAPRVAGVTIPITYATFVDDYIDSQRRRLPGRGS